MGKRGLKLVTRTFSLSFGISIVLCFVFVAFYGYLHLYFYPEAVTKQ